jgi:hypothetical protein
MIQRQVPTDAVPVWTSSIVELMNVWLCSIVTGHDGRGAGVPSKSNLAGSVGTAFNAVENSSP